MDLALNVSSRNKEPKHETFQWHDKYVRDFKFL